MSFKKLVIWAESIETLYSLVSMGSLPMNLCLSHDGMTPRWTARVRRQAAYALHCRLLSLPSIKSQGRTLP
jgi:hypothetical protein